MKPIFNNLTKLPEGEEQIKKRYHNVYKNYLDTESIIKIQGIYVCTILFKKSNHRFHFYKMKYLVVDPIFNKLRIYHNYNGIISDLNCRHNKAYVTYDLNKFINCSKNKWKKNVSRFKLIENISKNDNIFERLEQSKNDVIDVNIKIKNICNFASAHQSKIRILKRIIQNTIGYKLCY
tara:strand:- start:92 stop:625 length:534 start_codon:yes stop_codon:yes gene_type:complete